MTKTVWKLNVDGTRYPAIDGTESVSCELSRLNVGKITCSAATAYEVGTAVLIEEWDGSTYRTLLDGYIKKYTLVSKPRKIFGENRGTQYICKYEVAERAVELEQYRVNDGSSSIVSIPAGTMKEVLTAVLDGSGWTLDPACPTGATLPAMQFRWTTIMSALQKVAVEMGAPAGTPHYWLWFETTVGVAGGVVYVGTQRNDMTAEDYDSNRYYQYEEYKDNNKKRVDAVTVLGFNNEVDGTYPTGVMVGNIAVYSYTAATTSAECEILATNLYNDYLKDPERRIQFKVTPQNMLVGSSYIQEGDLISVDGESWVIVDVFYTPSVIQIGVNAGEGGVFGGLGNSLTVVSGSISTSTEQGWDGGWQNVAGDNTTITQFTMTVLDKNKIDGVVPLTVKLGAYRTYSQQSAVVVANSYLSTVDPISGKVAYTNIDAVGAHSLQYFPYDGTYRAISSPLLPVGCQFAVLTFAATLRRQDGSGVLYSQAYIQYAYTYTSTPPVGGWSYVLAGGAGIYYEYALPEQLSGIVVCDESISTRDGLLPTTIDGTGHITTYHYQRRYPSSTTSGNWSTNSIDAVTPMSITCIIPGTAAAGQYLHVRVYFYNASVATQYVYRNTAALQCMPRHTHDWTQTGQAANTVKAVQVDTVEDLVTTPTFIYYRVNGGAWTYLSCPAGSDYVGVVADIVGLLVSGINTIEFRHTTTACTVRPTATYKQFGS